MTDLAPEVATAISRIELPGKLSFLLDMKRYKVAYGGRGAAKCLALGTRIIMADGSLRAIEDVSAFEEVMGPDSKPRTVLNTTRGSGPLYRVMQTSGMEYVVNEDHILSVKKSTSAQNDKRTMATGNPRSPNGRYPSWPNVTNIGVQQYAAQSQRWRNHFLGYRAGCLSFPVKEVQIDPYFLGVWLGDGTGREMRVTTADKEIRDYCETIAQSHGGHISIGGKPGNKANDIGIVAMHGRRNLVWDGFKAYGLKNNKHIPEVYLMNHEEIRLQLLAGLIDTDGTKSHNGFFITQVNERLARDIKRLADGLGFRTSLNKRATICGNNGILGIAWSVSINGDTWRVPCLLPHKRVRQEEVRKNKDFLLSQLTVTPAGEGEWAGFTLDGDHLFCLEDGTVTHNSWSFADALLALAGHQKLRVLCAREIQRSIRQSVYQLLCDRIDSLGLGGFFHPSEANIVANNGSEFLFTGLSSMTVESIKSYEGIDIVWVEEGQTVSKRSWDILIPTIRADNSEIWVSFNPDFETDDTYVRFVVNPPPNAIVVKMLWYDNPWFPEVLEHERLHMKRTAPDDYENIWLGRCRTVVEGAIYAREMTKAVEEKRITGVPYDPRFPVHCTWDLGFNDSMAIIMAQKVAPSALNIINYMEDSFRTYAEYVADLNALGYVWGDDWLPHDGANKDPKAGASAQQVLRALGRRNVKIIARGDVELGIKNARSMFPRVYIDNTERKCHTGYLGGARLVECLRRYRRNVPKSTNEPASPVHDQFSHGADAWRGLATIVDQIRNEGDIPPPRRLAGYTNSDPGLGVLG